MINIVDMKIFELIRRIECVNTSILEGIIAPTLVVHEAYDLECCAVEVDENGHTLGIATLGTPQMRQRHIDIFSDLDSRIREAAVYIDGRGSRLDAVERQRSVELFRGAIELYNGIERINKMCGGPFYNLKDLELSVCLLDDTLNILKLPHTDTQLSRAEKRGEHSVDKLTINPASDHRFTDKLKEAEAYGFCRWNESQKRYEWTAKRNQCAYFCYLYHTEIVLSNDCIGVDWKPYERYFGIYNMRQMKYAMNTESKNAKQIEVLFSAKSKQIAER